MTPELLNQNMLPFARLMGIEITASSIDEVTAKMSVRADLCTAGELLHGGAIMAFADSVGAIGTFLNLPDGAKGTTTIESKTNFFRGTPAGETVWTFLSPHRAGEDDELVAVTFAMRRLSSQAQPWAGRLAAPGPP